MDDSGFNLFGFPVIVTDTAPKDKILFYRFPTWQELALHGSFEAAIQAQKNQWAKIRLAETDDE